MPTNNKLNEYVKREMVRLPKELQEAINAFGWEKVIEEIGVHNRLTEGEILTLKVETALILINLAKPVLFKDNIENNVGVSKKEAEKIAEEITELVFAPIGEKLESKIKEGTKSKNPTPKQNVDFIMSGGDYSSFTEKRGEAEKEDVNQQPKVPVKPGKITDIRSKFTI